MMYAEILKAVSGGGSAVAIIAVVILFLRQQEKANEALRQIAEKFTAEVRDSQRAFQEQINIMMGTIGRSQKLYQDQIRGLIDDHMIVTRETVAAVRGLDATVRSVETTVKELQAVVQRISKEK